MLAARKRAAETKGRNKTRSPLSMTRRRRIPSARRSSTKKTAFPLENVIGPAAALGSHTTSEEAGASASGTATTTTTTRVSEVPTTTTKEVASVGSSSSIDGSSGVVDKKTYDQAYERFSRLALGQRNYIPQTIQMMNRITDRYESVLGAKARIQAEHFKFNPWAMPPLFQGTVIEWCASQYPPGWGAVIDYSYERVPKGTHAAYMAFFAALPDIIMTLNRELCRLSDMEVNEGRILSISDMLTPARDLPTLQPSNVLNSDMDVGSWWLASFK